MERESRQSVRIRAARLAVDNCLNLRPVSRSTSIGSCGSRRAGERALGGSRSDFVGQFGTGGFLHSIAFAVVCVAVGYVLSPPHTFRMQAVPDQTGTTLADAIGTGQKGSQMLIASLIIALGADSVAGVGALASSLIIIAILGAFAAEAGTRFAARGQEAR